jgi:hypothetical protein
MMRNKGLVMKLTPRKKLFVETAAGMFGNGAVINKQEIREAADKAGVPYPSWMSRTKVGYNMHKLPDLEIPAFVGSNPAVAPVNEENSVFPYLMQSNSQQHFPH